MTSQKQNQRTVNLIKSAFASGKGIWIIKESFPLPPPQKAFQGAESLKKTRLNFHDEETLL